MKTKKGHWTIPGFSTIDVFIGDPDILKLLSQGIFELMLTPKGSKVFEKILKSKKFQKDLKEKYGK